MAYYAAFYALSENGQRERAITYLERWVNQHPEDNQARQILDDQRRQLGEGPESRRVLPRPPLPNLP